MFSKFKTKQKLDIKGCKRYWKTLGYVLLTIANHLNWINLQIVCLVGYSCTKIAFNIFYRHKDGEVVQIIKGHRSSLEQSDSFPGRGICYGRNKYKHYVHVRISYICSCIFFHYL